jgi:hypothetical protein
MPIDVLPFSFPISTATAYPSKSPFTRYRVRPTFGPAETVLPKLLAARQTVRQLHTTMQCKHAQMALLQGAEPTKVC